MVSNPDVAMAIDLTDCDREPIHIPGSIQPHGLILIVDAATRRVIAGAGALEPAFGDTWLDASIDDLVWPDGGAPSFDAATPGVIGTGAAAGPGMDAGAGAIDTAAGRFDIAVHRSGDRVIVELEAAGDPLTAGASLHWLETTAGAFERAVDVAALCRRAAVAFRALTGFDRVMIYRFLDDDAGRVVAEDSDPAIGSFLNHHFPATDIPKQARALYIRNRTRAIPDIGYTPQPIRPAAYRDTDLSDVATRSVSPIHIQYLHNMGVGASASISIVKDGQLWGLVACHHREPRLMPREIRLTASTLAGIFARQVRAKEDANAYRERLRLSSAADAILPIITGARGLRAEVRDGSAALMAMLDGDGLVFAHGNDIDGYGHCPDPRDLREIVRWLRRRPTLEPFATSSLVTQFDDADDMTASASGLLAIPLGDDGAMLLWLRAEQVQTVEWAGNPHKAAAGGESAPLTPRASFASWTQTVRGESRGWTLEEIEAAHKLRRTIDEASRRQRIDELNDRLTRSLADKDALLAQKDLLMKEVDHRVQNSLQLVSAFLSMQARAAGPGEVAASLAEAQSRLSAVALVHRRLYRDDQIESIDLSRYLGDLIDDLRGSLGDGWGSRMNVDLAPVLVPTDRAVSVGLVLAELVINATKYAYAGEVGPIDICLDQHRRRFRLIVADQGRGVVPGAAPTGAGGGTRSGGFGSRMMTAVVDRLDGEIELTDNQPGTRAILTAPVGDLR